MSGEANREWFYSDGVEQRGPVGKTELQSLRGEGKITDDSLVWNEALPDWMRFGDIAELGEVTRTGAAIPPEADEQDTVICAHCQEPFPRSAMLQYGDLWVAAAHKDEFVQSIGEGALVGDDLDGLDDFEADMSLPSILRQSWIIFASQALEFALITVIIWAPFYFLIEYFAYQSVEVVPEDEFGWAGLIQGSKWERLFETWIGSIAAGGIISVAASRWQGAAKAGLGETFSRGFENWGRLIGTRILTGITIILPALVVFLPAFLVEIPVFQILWGTVGGCALVYVWVRISFGEYLAVINQEGGSAAISESWRVTKGRFWRITGYQIALFLPVLFAIFASSVIYMIPLMDNFVVSALHSLAVSIFLNFTVVVCGVLAIHLKHCPESGA